MTIHTAVVVGNATGNYSAPMVTTETRLVIGFAVEQQTVSPKLYLLAGTILNTVSGWTTGFGTITDATHTNWTGFQLIWLYQ